MSAADNVTNVSRASAQGLSMFPGADQFSALYPQVAQRNFSAGIPSSRMQDFIDYVTLSLKYRGLIYAKKTPGDCGGLGTATGGISGRQIVGLAGQASSLTVGGLGAVGVLSGAATFGIGAAITVAVAAISDIFQHHAQAIANEQSTICAVVNYFNEALRAVDQAVASGQISAGEGVTYLNQVANQAKTGLSSIEKVCNAACWFKGFIAAHQDFARQYYAAISPNSVGALRPGQAPTAFGSLPGGVPSTANNVAPSPPIRSLLGLNPTPVNSSANPVSGTVRSIAVQSNQTPTGQSGKLSDVPPAPSSGLGWGFFAVAATVLLLIFTGTKQAAAAA